MAIHETYLGDGVYARFDGFQLRLWTPREDGEHFIVLEPDVLENLVRFLDKVNQREDTE